MSPLLDAIASPEELRRLPEERLPEVCAELRGAIIEAISRTGGHLAAGLGAVELAVALHYVFDTPSDRLIWDVGHQGYPHKMLTGRRADFASIGKKDGMGKFLRRHESEYDVFGAGHAGTSISAAAGIAEAIRRRGGAEKTIAVIGDGALTAGMAYEGLNNAGYLGLANLVVVLNDNEMSISKNVGALTSFLARRWSAPVTRRLKHGVKSFLESLPAGAPMVELARRAEQSFKAFISPAMLFEGLGFNYIGPIDGHNVRQLVATLRNVRDIEDNEHPVLVHCRTQKGHGYEPSQADPVKYHGVSKFEVSSGTMEGSGGGAPSWTHVFASALIDLAREDERIVAITAAMAGGTGLDQFQRVFPDRFYDVGIAEQHAVTFAGGLATEGLKPVCAIYSTFLQRAYDQIVHDICVQNLDVTFAIDRAGIVGADGATHQGMFDIAYLRTLPHMIVMAPRDDNELRRMLRTAIGYPGPAALRYPRGSAPGVPLDPEIKPLEIGRAELLREGSDLALVALGSMVAPALEAAERLRAQGIAAAVLDARFAKPLDAARLCELARRCGRMLVVEEHARMGGFGDAVAALLAEAGVAVRLRSLGIPDALIEHGNPDQWLAELGLDAAGIERAPESCWVVERTAPGKVRVDQRVLELGLEPSRARAQARIMAGDVRCGDRVLDKPGTLIPADSALELRARSPYVSRGGEKLAGALAALAVDPAGLRCADVGASTGGFTDCLLQRGAAEVLALDVGHGQLAVRLRADARVSVRERTNARYYALEPGVEPFDLVTADLSFISLRRVLEPLIGLVRPGGRLLLLVKPQFELGRGLVGKGGVVRDPALRARAVQLVRDAAVAAGLEPQGEADSVLPGPKGNLERFLLLRRAPPAAPGPQDPAPAPRNPR